MQRENMGQCRRGNDIVAQWILNEASVQVLTAGSLNSASDYSPLPVLLLQDAVSLLWACGQVMHLQQLCSNSSSSSMDDSGTSNSGMANCGSSSPHAARQSLFHNLCSHTARWIQYANNTADPPDGLSRSNPSLLDDWNPEDLVDAVAGLAAAQHKSPAAAQLLDATAHEVYRQLSNRHSTAGSFTVDGVVTLLDSYASLQYRDGEKFPPSSLCPCV